MAILASLSSLYGARGGTCLKEILASSPFLTQLESCSAWELDATTFDFMPTTGTSSVNYRDLNGTISTPSDIALTEKQSASLANMFDHFDIDASYQADASKGLRDIPTWLDKHLRRKYKAFGLSLENQLFNGSGAGTPKQIKGLKAILSGADLPGYTGAGRLFNAASYGAASVKSLDLTGDTNNDRFMNMFEDALSVSDVTGMSIVVNPAMASKLNRIADLKRQGDMIYTAYGTTLRTFYGLPIVIAKPATITKTEPDDTTTALNETTSMYLINPGEMKTSLVTNSGLEYYEYDRLENKQSGRERWEIRAQWKVETPETVLRIRNIKI